MIKRLTKNNNVYHLSLGGFLKTQKEIADKYMCKLNRNTNMEIIDKYILQIIEEAWEAENSEILKDGSNKNEELCDTLMYIGSLFTIISDRQGFGLEVEEDFLLSDEKIDVSLGYISNILISIRRFYPERKWHKSEINPYSMRSIDKISLDLLLDLMLDIIKYLLIIDFDIKKYIAEKQKLILDNSEVKVDNKRELRNMTVYRHFNGCKYIVLGSSQPMEILPTELTIFKEIIFSESTDKVITIYRDTDFKLYHDYQEFNEELVVYTALYDNFETYGRELSMFLSEVDREKYPDVIQRYRFEEVYC